MTNIEQENDDLEIEITENEHTDNEETELEDIEEATDTKIKTLRAKLTQCEDEKRQILENSQRDKAEFLNARKRIEEDKQKDRVRQRMDHVFELLPLCDSFEMAMSNTEAWEKADKNWRVGVEGIKTQLMKILESYNVSTINQTGENFDPYRHEAIGTEAVIDESLKDKIIKVVQSGYEMKIGDKTELIRPARVTIGTLKE